MDDVRALYKVGVVVSVRSCSTSKGGKPLKACQFDIGDEEPIAVVTAAPNVREGSRLAVAPVGSKFVDDSGEQVEVQKTVVGGVVSEGIFCDSRMLGWSGGAEGVAAQIPESVALGQAPPATKPRSDPSGNTASGQEEEPSPAVQIQPLFEKKLSKEERKKLAEEKKKARKAAKEVKKQVEGDDE